MKFILHLIHETGQRLGRPPNLNRGGSQPSGLRRGRPPAAAAAVHSQPNMGTVGNDINL